MAKKGKLFISIFIVLFFGITVVFCFSGFDLEQTEENISSLCQNAESALGLLDNQVNDGIAVHFIDVGQGDCELIVCGSHAMLIDAGENGNEKTVSDYIHTCGIYSLDYVVATHPHSDHVGSLDYIVENFRTEKVLISAISSNDEENYYSEFLNSAYENGAEVVIASPGDAFSVGEATVTTVGPLSNSEDLNDMSLVLRVDYKKASFLFSGDAQEKEETEILSSGVDIDCDVLKAGHHGSFSASSSEYLAAVTPKIVVINCGLNNAYGHPNPNTVKRMKKYTDKIYRTDICSDILITSNGEEYNIKYGK